MRLDPEILDGPPETGARVLALARLADAEDAVAPLADPARRDALPAFRSAVRRLAVALQAGAPALSGAVPESRLARVEAAAPRGALRDAEVLAGWLDAIRGDLPAPYRGALDWLVDRVERRRRAAVEEAAGEAGRRFRRLAARLRAELTARAPPPARRPGAPASFAEAIAAAARARTRALRDAAIAVSGPADAPGLGRLRREAKRLRDLLEPLRDAVPPAAAALEALRPLHDAVAGWHGAAAAEAGLDGALLELRAEEARRGEAAIAGLRPGLLALLRLARERAADAYARLASEHLATRAAAATDAAYAAVAALESAADAGAEAGPPAAPERRFLVTAVPPEARGGGVEDLEQGWLPGDERESVGVTRSALGEQWFRARAPARGRAGRLETIGRADFDAFWPLTAGRRIAKRRHLVAASPGWHFDEYLDRPLVLAVSEEGNAEEPPPWLEPVLVREVSAERSYLDEALARRPPRRTG
jgi:CHAD domain-containing protein/CYTH domain-containing protein